MSAKSSYKIAAIQIQGTPGAVDDNLERISKQIEQAVADGAEIIALPEFFPSPLPFKTEVHASVLPPDNPARQLLLDTATTHGVTIGGSMLIAKDDAIYNRYHLVEPDGSVHLHDKDLPTMWENCFYGPGNDDGVFDTAIGGVGAAVCWELIRTQTVQRMQQRVGLALTGTHWWTMPSNWGRITDAALKRLGTTNRGLSDQAPSQFAQVLGAPVVQASHCGEFDTDFMLAPGLGGKLPYHTEFVGATQIVNAQGTVLARRDTREGPGIVMADVAIGQQQPVNTLPNRFWLPKLPLFLHAYWHHQNLCGKSYYRRQGRAAGLAAAATSDT